MRRIAGAPSLRETLDGVTVERVWVYASPGKGARARLLNQFSFMLMAALRGMFLQRPDVILVESHPLFVCLTGGWLRWIKRAPAVLNVSDLWPESAVATGALREDSLMVKSRRAVERWAYHDAAHVVGMTGGVVDGILTLLPDPARVTLIKNAVDLALFHPASAGFARCRPRALRIGRALHCRARWQHEPDLRPRHHARRGGGAARDRRFCSPAADRRRRASKRRRASGGLSNVLFAGCCPTPRCRASGRQRMSA